MNRLHVQTILFLGLFAGLMMFSIKYVSANELRRNQEACTGTWSFPPMYVGGEDGIVYAERAYEFDENCNPFLVEEIRLDYLPASVIQSEQVPVEVKTIEIVPPPPPNKNDNSLLAVNTCHVKTWEEDVIGIDMIAVQNNQNYSWNGSTVTLSSGTVSATTYFSWWYLNSGPTGSAGYNSSTVAWAKGNAGFYCNGGPFCGGGPMYHITLYNDMTVDAWGGCGGHGTYSGTVVPGGRVRDSAWKS